jgi:FHS family L-fucose permease-like MFS transporter
MLVAQMFILQSLKSNVANYDMLSAAEKTLIKTHDLETIRNPYIILGIVVIVFFVVISLYKMPKNKNSDHEVNIKGTIAKLFKIPRFREGVIAQMFYVGAQIMLWTFIFQYAENIGIENSTTVYYNMAAMGIFLSGRFVFTFLLKYINSGKLLMILAIFAIIFTLGAIFIHGIYGLYSLVAISFTMSLMFPTIYGISLRGLGEDAKFGSAFLVMAIVGGALLPLIQASIMDIGGKGFNDTLILGVPEVNFSFVLPLFCFVVVAIFGYRSYKIHMK